MMEKNATESQDDSNLMQDNTGRKFQSACHIWFCPTDEKIATELRRMAHDEREKVWADLSGNEKTSMFKQVVMEDPNEISEGLNQLQREVDSTKEKPAFDFARRQSPEYVQDRSFQLVFLRSCEYDGKRAGRLLIDHMETKRRLFGDSALGRDIRLSDLNTNDMKTLITGGIQFLHERDRAGRIVLYCRRSSMEFKERENFVSPSSCPSFDTRDDPLPKSHYPGLPQRPSSRELFSILS